MSDKGFFSSICGFFNSLFVPAQQQAEATAEVSTGVEDVTEVIQDASEAIATPTMTGVARYIESLASRAITMTGVERYIQNNMTSNHAWLKSHIMTGVERYIQHKASN